MVILGKLWAVWGLWGTTITFRLGDTELGQNHLKLLGENQSYWKEGALLIFYRLNVKRKVGPAKLASRLIRLNVDLLFYLSSASGLQSLPTTTKLLELKIFLS